MSVFRARLVAGRNGDDGFTVIELMVATTVLMVAVVSMLYTTYAGFRGIATARLRQTATGLANRSMEQIRALPFDTVKRGLDNTDLSTTAGTTDTNISVTGSGGSAVYSYGGEQIPRGDNSTTTPLVPHKQSVVLNNLTYTVAAYITYYQNQTTSNTYRATVIVSWPNSPNGGGTTSTTVQTIIYSPSGGESCGTVTHPFAAPCQAFLFGSASNTAGQINLAGTIAGISLDHATLSLPGQSSGTQIEQVQAVQGSAQTSGIALQLVNGSVQASGAQAVTSGADNDPSQPKPGYQTASSGAQGSATLSASGSNNTLTVSAAAGDTAATTSTINSQLTADGSSPPKYGPCLVSPSSSFDQSQTDQLACGNSKSQQGGTLSAALGIKAGPNTVNTTLASIAAPSGPSGAFTNKDATPETTSNGTVCAATSGDGCMQSLQYRQRGTVSLLQLPIGTGQLLSILDLPGYDVTKGLVQLTGYSDSVSAEAGVGAGKPAATISGGTISYFNGLTYSTLSLTGSAGSTPTTIPIGLNGGGIHIGDTFLTGALLQLDVSANLTTGGKSVSDPAGCSSTCTRTQASATVASPITGSFTFTLTYAGTVLANVSATVDLGTLLAKSSYQAAPSGG
jgi:hypothetical protein